MAVNQLGNVAAGCLEVARTDQLCVPACVGAPRCGCWRGMLELFYLSGDAGNSRGFC